MISFFRSNLQRQAPALKTQPNQFSGQHFYPLFYKLSAWGMVFGILFGFIGCSALYESAWADCQSNYKQAMDLLDTTTKKASQNEHPDADAFSSQFKTIVGSLQSQKCLPELMSLIQHIQSEQQKIPSSTFPAEAKDNRTPITD